MSEESSSRKKKAPIGPIVGVVLLLVGGLYGFRFWKYNSTHATTDDAYVTGDVVPVSALVPGIVGEILVSDNQRVEKGQLLVRLDKSTFQAQVAEAEANLALAKAAAGGTSVDVVIAEQTGVGQVSQAESAVQVEDSNVATARALADETLSGVAAAEAALKTSEADAAAAQQQIKSKEAALRRLRQSVEALKAQVQSAEAAVGAAKANVDSARAAAQNARREADRAKELFASGAISRSQADQRETQALSTQAAFEAAQQQVQAAQANVSQKRADLAASKESISEAEAAVTQAEAQASASNQQIASRKAQLTQSQIASKASRQAISAAEAKKQQALGKLKEVMVAPKRADVSAATHESALAKVKQAAAALQAARIALSRTEIRAPVAGIVSRKTAQPGQQLALGQPLMVLISADKPWIVANFKETQLDRIHPGLKVEIKVDALPGATYVGTVDSISRGTGSTFALLPPDNASGNFNKIVQRVPVKITLDDQAKLEDLRVGLSSFVAISLRS